MKEHSKAFEYAKEITVAAVSTAGVSVSGEDVATFFEAVFKKLSELENKACN